MTWLIALLLPAAGLAGDAAVHTEAFEPDPVAGHPVLDLRLGAGTTGPGTHGTLCAEAYPLARLSLEACGNGAGFVHRADVPDFAHFRARVTVLQAREGRNEIGLVAGAGFSEIQVGEDAPGFQFGPAQSADQNSGAGPEASVSGKARHWMTEHAYMTADVNAGAALIPSAPVVLGEGGPVVPFVSATVGLGF